MLADLPSALAASYLSDMQLEIDTLKAKVASMCDQKDELLCVFTFSSWGRTESIRVRLLRLCP